jgi:uncharacterized membrane protein
MTTREEHSKIRAAFLQSEEARIFIAGCCMLILWVATIAVLSHYKYQHWLDILKMSLSHLMAGRAVGILTGSSAEMPPRLIATVASYIDVMVMFIIYPLLIFSYRNLLERRFFKQHVRPMIESAQRSVTRFRKYKIIGVFCFVWFPFWMTGIVMGAVLGYLLGLKTHVNMTTVILGSISAVVSWVYVAETFFDKLRTDMHEAIPTVITLVIIVILAAMRIVKNRRETHARQENPE